MLSLLFVIGNGKTSILNALFVGLPRMRNRRGEEEFQVFDDADFGVYASGMSDIWLVMLKNSEKRARIQRPWPRFGQDHSSELHISVFNFSSHFQSCPFFLALEAFLLDGSDVIRREYAFAILIKRATERWGNRQKQRGLLLSLKYRHPPEFKSVETKPPKIQHSLFKKPKKRATSTSPNPTDVSSFDGKKRVTEDIVCCLSTKHFHPPKQGSELTSQDDCRPTFSREPHSVSRPGRRVRLQVDGIPGHGRHHVRRTVPVLHHELSWTRRMLPDHMLIVVRPRTENGFALDRAWCGQKMRAKKKKKKNHPQSRTGPRLEATL